MRRVDKKAMHAAASVSTPADGVAQAPRRRRPHLGATRRSGLYFLGGLLLLAAIPIVATLRILDQSALRNARAHADAVLRLELEAGVNRLGHLGDDASTHADDLIRAPNVAQAFINGDRAAIANVARRYPGLVFNLNGRTVAGKLPPLALTRTVWLTVNGKRIGSLVGTVALDERLGVTLLRASSHGPDDRLLIVHGGAIVGTNQSFTLDNQTARVGGTSYRALLTPIPTGSGARLVALRPDSAIQGSVQPYERRIMYAATGSFAMLLLIGLLFARPILTALGDFRRLASQATTDALTGIPNRRSFDEELTLEWRRAERVGESLALILADIDDFKTINDRFGHQVGDAVLAKVGEVLAARVRQIDFAARYGGEEFAVLVPESEIAGARSLAQRLRGDLAKARIELPDGDQLHVTASFGVAAKGDLKRAEELIAAADAALYEAKRRGKNRVASRRTAAVAAA
jgi:diguanylate cyclase (GGDEF)-like protein